MLALRPADGARTHRLLGARETRAVTFPRQQTAFLKARPLTTSPRLPTSIVNLASEGQEEDREQNNLVIRLAGADLKSEGGKKPLLIGLFITLHQCLLGCHSLSYYTSQCRRVHYYTWGNEIQRESSFQGPAGWTLGPPGCGSSLLGSVSSVRVAGCEVCWEN